MEENPEQHTTSIYRELGQIEGRVSALEESTKDIKALLSGITGQLNNIQLTVANALGSQSGGEKVWETVKFLINSAIAAGTAFLILHFGK